MVENKSAILTFLQEIKSRRVCLFFTFDRIIMKSTLLIIILSLFFIGCRKTKDAIPYGNCTHYSQNNGLGNNPGGPFSFSSIEINPNPVKKGVAAKVIAHATGSNLTFRWSTPHGDLFGTGSAIYYSDSCIGTFEISCTVSDGSNSATITVPVTVSN